MIEYQTFFTPSRLDEFWLMVKWVLFFVAPGIMIYFAVHAVGWLVHTIRVSLLGEAQKEEKDDDYEVYRY
jgi:hypothetical protein